MSDSFVVMNNTATVVSLAFDSPFTMEDYPGISQLKRRRLIRSATSSVALKPRQSLDLVLHTNLDSEYLSQNKDLQKFIKDGILLDMRESKNDVVEILEEKEEEVAEEVVVLEEDVQEMAASPELQEEGTEEVEGTEETVESKPKKRGRKSKKAGK